MKDMGVVIIGAGLSGLSSGVELVERGKRVLVLEAQKVVGGRTSSWDYDGMKVESGLHRFLGFFEHLPNLIEKVGVKVDDIICWEDEIEIKLPLGQPSAVFGFAPLHKPLKTLGGLLLNNDFLSVSEKIKISKFITAGFLELKNNPKKLDQISVYNFAKQQDLEEKTIERVLVPFTEGLFFIPIKKYSAYNFFALFAPYLNKAQKMRVGAFMGGMSEVMAEPIAKYIKKKGGRVKTSSPVERLIIKDSQVLGVVVNGEEIRAERVVIAASLKDAQNLISKHFKNHPEFKKFLSLKSMPTVTFQIELTEPAMEVDRTTFSPGTYFSSYSEQSRTTFRDSKGRLSVILSDPEKTIELNTDQILEKILKDAEKLGLNLRKQNIKDFRKIDWPNDFITYEKGTYKKRPSQKTSVQGLILAGDYTDQEYLSTMEGAVYSGKLAAKTALLY